MLHLQYISKGHISGVPDTNKCPKTGPYYHILGAVECTVCKVCKTSIACCVDIAVDTWLSLYCNIHIMYLLGYLEKGMPTYTPVEP